MENIKNLDVIPLYNRFRKAIVSENYELCSEIQKEFRKRKESNTLCPFSVIILKKSTFNLYVLLD